MERAKIPCKETGITVKRTVCNVCCSAFYCGQLAYLKDGKIIKVEGDPEHPLNHGLLCTKGLATREYIYSPHRIKSPLLNVGKKGEGRFVPISWEEAYDRIASRLNETKDRYGADSVVFFSGNEKWYQNALQRLCYSFGSVNYCNASGTCFEAQHMAWKLSTGRLGLPDIANAGVYLAFSYNQFYSRPLEASIMEQRRSEGLKVVVIDPRKTPAVDRFADIHLQNLPGTDGAIALGMANLFIKNDWIDHKYIRDHVHGFNEYREYVSRFTPECVEKISKVRKEDLIRAVEFIHRNMPMAIHESVSPIVHHKNGMQNYRAMISLSAITGCYDKKGGNIPRFNTFSHQGAGFQTREHEFIHETEPKHTRPTVGSQRFPLFEYVAGYGQCTDLPRQILEKKPYPIKALVAFGLNYRMFPGDGNVIKALKELDYFINVDLFMTDSSKYADMVLPACTIAERNEIKVYRGGFAHYSKAIIEPLFQSRSDAAIIQELAQHLNLKDSVLTSGYDSWMEYIFRDCGVTIQKLKKSDRPVHLPCAEKYQERAFTNSGYDTPTGKFELLSTVIEKIPKEYGYEPLPTYKDSLDNSDPKLYPFVLFTGSSIPNGYNDRLNRISSLRQMRKYPMADISLRDADKLNLNEGDEITVSTTEGEITLLAHPSEMIMEGTVSIYHGYKEADVNSLISNNHLDPYSGFPGYKSVRCSLRKKGAR